MKSQKLVIPLSMRQYILELLHKAHLRIEKLNSGPELRFTGQKYPETSNHTFKNVKNASNIDTKALKKLLTLKTLLGQKLDPIYLSIQVNYLLLLLTISQNSLN